MAVSVWQRQLIAIARLQSTTLKPTVLLSVAGALTLTACQTVPMSPSSPTGTVTNASSSVIAPADSRTHDRNMVDSADSIDEDGYSIETYTPPVQAPIVSYPPVSTTPSTIPDSARPYPSTPQTSSDPVIVTPAREGYTAPPPSPAIPSRNELLERARQNSQQQRRQSTTDQSQLPAFRSLMQTGTSQLKAGNLTAAENSFTRAQRLAPRSSAVYFYLAQVALKKNQPRKAEAMARRGLNVAEDDSRRRSLWQIILRSGQLQNDARVIREAQQALR